MLKAKSFYGNILVQFLVLSALLASVLFVVAALNYGRMVMVSTAGNGQVARNLAESTIAMAFGRIQKRAEYGATQSPLDDITFHPDGYPASSKGSLTFVQTSGSLYSLNNLKGETTVAGCRATTVPSQSAHLVAVGTHQGITHRVEAIINIPAYPYVVASSGQMDSTGGLMVASLKNIQALMNGMAGVRPEDLEEGHIMTRATDSNGDALKLRGSDTVVYGDALAAGTVTATGGAVVKGQKRSNASTPELPTIDLSSYDTSSKPGLFNISSASLSSDLSIDTYARRGGSLTVDGALKLNGGVLYVDGDLEVRGGITGKGAVIVKGNATIKGGGELNGSSLSALLCDGDLTIEGSQSNPATYQGLVYSQGNAVLRYSKVAGIFLANGKNGKPGSAQLDNSTIYQLKEAGKIQFPVRSSTPGSSSIQIGIARSDNLAPGTATDGNGGAGAGSTAFSGTSEMHINILPVNQGIPDAADPWNSVQVQVLGPNGTEMVTGRDNIINALAGSLGGSANAEAFINSLNDRVGNMNTAAADALTNGSYTPPTSSTSNWSLDLSQFMNVADQMRVLVWRDF